MLVREVVCRKCGDTAFDAVERGAYLKRVNPTGKDFIGECSPCCEGDYGGSVEALPNAIEEK